MPQCLLSILTDEATVDVVLPDALPVAGLLPDVVALTGCRAGTGLQRWHLTLVSGDPIDEDKSLTENGIRDGDTLLLATRAHVAPLRRPWDTARVVETAAAAPESRIDAVDIGAAAVTVALIALCWAGSAAEHRWLHVAIAAVLACAVTARAMAIDRDLMHLCGVIGWATAGFLAIPAGSTAGSVLVAAVVAGCAATLLTRWCDVSAGLAAATSCAFLVALAAAVATAWPIPAATAGAALAVSGLALLAVSARIAVLAAGLPRDGHGGDAGPARAHALLDGLVIGVAAAITAGIAVAAATAPTAVRPAALGFAAAAAVTLVLRARVHADPARRMALLLGGSCCAAIALVSIVCAYPAAAPWSVAAVATTTLAAGASRDVGPAASRCIDVLEYVAIAAVIPLACWVAGLYTVARGWHTG